MGKKRVHHNAVFDGEIRDFKKCLLHARCAKCGSKLEWEPNSDTNYYNEVPRYYADCCYIFYEMAPHTAKIKVDESQVEEFLELEAEEEKKAR